MAEKEATVFIIDVGKSMGDVNHERDKSDLDWSLQWLWDRLTNIVYLGRKTLFVAVVALGSNETNNSMSGDPSYNHIDIIQNMSPMTMSELRPLPDKIKPSYTDQRDAISSVILAVDMIMRHCRHLQFKKKIYLITNATGAMDADDIDSTADQIKNNNIELTVLGVDFDDAEYGFKEEDKSTTKTKNERLLKKLVADSGGTFGTMQEAIDSLDIPHTKPVRPTPTYKGQLRLGDPSIYDTAITIDVERYFKSFVRKPPTASSFATRAEPSQTDSDLAPTHTARVYAVRDPGEPQNEKTVDREELARGYQYGRTAVPISESDENITKLETDAGYEILGFVVRKNIERYTILENTNMLVAQKGNDKAALALSSMVHALFEIDSCAIARLVKKDMSEPSLTLLTPFADEEVECLIENLLPFAEDLREYRFPPLDKVITVSGKHLESHRNLPNSDLVDAMSSFVDDMTVGEDEFRIEDTYSPLLHTIESAVKHRAVHPKGAIPAVSVALMKSSQQSEELRYRSRSSLRDLINVADVKRVPPKVKGRRRFRDMEKPLSGLNVADLFRNEKRTKISPDNAIPEFVQITTDAMSLDDIGDIAKQFMTIIEDHVRTSYGDANYEKVIEEIGVLRNELGQMEMFDVWHELIKDLKEKILSEKLGGNRKELWYRIRLSKLGLFSSTEELNAGLTKEEADKFLSSK